MPELKVKAEIMDAQTVDKTLRRIAYEILEKNKTTDNLVIIGIQTKGVVLADKIAKKIKEIENIDIPVGSMDITFYRDDLTMLAEHPVINGNDIAFSVYDKNIVIVDDVLYTGRTIRAAIEEIFDMGRPSKIQLAILVDRGHRELPICADYIGKNVPASKNENINVEIESGEIKRVTICDML